MAKNEETKPNKKEKYIALIDITTDSGEIIKINEEIKDISKQRIKWLLDSNLIVDINAKSDDGAEETN